MKNIFKINDLVEDTLISKPETRNSDVTLYINVCMAINPDVQYMGFLHVLNNMKELGIPNYESVRRARQKLQADHPNLRANESVIDGRYEAFKEVMKYVNS